MLEISFEIDGEEVRPSGMKDALDSLFLKHIREQVAEKVGSARCPRHGREPRIKITGSTIDNLRFEVTGCCEDFTNKIQNKF